MTSPKQFKNIFTQMILGWLLTKLFKWFWSIAYLHLCANLKFTRWLPCFVILNIRPIQGAWSLDIWYVASPCRSLPSLFKLCPWGQKWPRPCGQMFYLGLYRENEKKSCLKPQGLEPCELMVYQSLQRLLVHPSVRQHFQTSLKNHWAN